MRHVKAEGFQLHLLLGEGGPLLDEYRSVAPVTLWPASSKHVVNALADMVLGKLGQWERFYQRQLLQQQKAVRDQLALDSFDLVFVNTVMSSRWFSLLGIPEKTPVITFVHELDMSVRLYTRPDQLAHLLQRSNHILAVSKATARYYEQQHAVDPNRVTLFTLIDTPSLERSVQQAKSQPDLYRQLGLPENALLVGGCGNAEWRKGNDLFITLARQVIGRASEQPIHFVWVGIPPSPLYDDLSLDIRKAGLSERVHLIAPTPDVLRYMSRFDVFVLCSREDPYPLVVFEAGLSNVPVVCFDGAGGAPELVEADGGFVVPYLDLDAMSTQTLQLLQNPDLRQQMGKRLSQKIMERHPAHQSVETIVTLFHQFT